MAQCGRRESFGEFTCRGVLKVNFNGEKKIFEYCRNNDAVN